MSFINVLFIVLSAIFLAYALYATIRKGKRIPTGMNAFFAGFFGLILILFLFPDILRWIEATLGIPSAINLFIYISIFVAYLFIMGLYKRIEQQRQDITALAREVALRKK